MGELKRDNAAFMILHKEKWRSVIHFYKLELFSVDVNNVFLFPLYQSRCGNNSNKSLRNP